jgi:hypothetical protein
MSGPLVVIDAQYTVSGEHAKATGLAPLMYGAHQAALGALMNINAEIMRCEKACKAMDQYIKSGDFSMSSERAQKRLKEQTAKAFEAKRLWHEKFDGREVLPKP